MAIAPYQWDEQVPPSNRMGALEPQPTIAPGILAQAVKRTGPSKTMNTIGIIADALAALGGSQPHYTQSILQQRREERDRQQPLLQQQLDMLKWRNQQDYKREHPEPYNFQANNGDQMQIGPDGQPRMVYKDPTPKIDWIMAEDPATGIKSLVPKPQMAPAMGPPPGVTFTPRGGGAGSQAPRTFR